MEEILRGLSTDEPAETREHGEARLYYDCGARGNPGRSGAGAVLLERHSENRSWEIVWWAATYVGDHSTSNVAEHQALAQGLCEAARRYGPSRLKIDIVGDSMLVTRQFIGQIRATKPHFSESLHQSRSALLKLFDYGLHHTLRASNKAADWLASYAMDQQISIVSVTATARGRKK
jgi:ribonuclease HI